MIAVVCGSRDWTDNDLIEDVLMWAYTEHNLLQVIEGGASGAARAAAWWAGEFMAGNVTHTQMKARWSQDGNAAGPKRNQRMLDHLLAEQADMRRHGSGGLEDPYVLAFKDDFDWTYQSGGGTEHMVQIAAEAGVPTFVVSHR